jgi:uncharacterized protein YndB with AHSA1/START domain
MSRKIEKEVTIEATPEEVWRALTEAELINCWFGPEARVTPGVGGSLLVSWGPGFEIETKIDIWEPNQHLRTRDDKKPVTVDYILEGKGGTTTLRLVQTVGDGWEDEFDGSDLGWTIFLGTLKDYFARHRGAACRQAYCWLPVSGDAAALWQRLLGPRGFGVGDAGVGSSVEAESASGDKLSAEIVLLRRERPMGIVFEARNLDARVYCSLEEGKGGAFVWLNVFAYGAPAPQVDAAALVGRWKTMLEAALAS